MKSYSNKKKNGYSQWKMFIEIEKKPTEKNDSEFGL